MNIFDFVKNFPGEEACMLHFKAQTVPSRQTLRSGTVSAHTHLLFQYRLYSDAFFINEKKTFSASELQRQLGHKRL